MDKDDLTRAEVWAEAAKMAHDAGQYPLTALFLGKVKALLPPEADEVLAQMEAGE